MLKPCIICYRLLSDDFHSKTGSSPPDSSKNLDGEMKGEERLKRFFQLLERYLNDGVVNEGLEAVKRFPLTKKVMNLSGMCCDCCGNCSYLVESFCELYHQMKSIDLFLSWKVEVLKRIMFSAQRLPSRICEFREAVTKQLQAEDGSADENIDLILDFKRDLIEKCKRKIQAAFPKVALKKHQLPRSRGLLLKHEPQESIETEYGHNEDLTPTCVYKGDTEVNPLVNWIKMEVDPKDDGFQPDLNSLPFEKSHVKNTKFMDIPLIEGCKQFRKSKRLRKVHRCSPLTKRAKQLRRSKRLCEVHRCSKCTKTFSNLRSLLQHEGSHNDEEENANDNVMNEALSNWSNNESEEEFDVGEEKHLNNLHRRGDIDDLCGLDNFSLTTPSTQAVVNNQEAVSYNQFNPVSSWEEGEDPYSNAAIPYVEKIIMEDPIAIKYEPEQDIDMTTSKSTGNTTFVPKKHVNASSLITQQYKCKYCNNQFKTMNEMRNHVTLLHFSKSFCQVLISGKLAVQYSPIVMVPPDFNRFAGSEIVSEGWHCARCSLKFASAWSYHYHYRSVHVGVSFMCCECNSKGFINKESLLQHQMTTNCKSDLNSSINTILIEEDEDKYFQRSAHLNAPKFPVPMPDHLCDLCGIDFGCKTSFMEHRSSSHPESLQDLLEIFPPTPTSPIGHLSSIEDNDEDDIEIIDLVDSPKTEPESSEVICQVSQIQSSNYTDSDISDSTNSKSLCVDNPDLESEEMHADEIHLAAKKSKLDDNATNSYIVIPYIPIFIPIIPPTVVNSDSSGINPGYKCKHCGTEFLTKNDVRIHVALLHLYKATGKILIPGKVAVQHSPAISAPPKPAKEPRILSRRSKNRKCLHCSERFASYWAYQYHYSNVHMGVTWRCECNKVFDQKEGLLQHQLICNPNQKPSSGMTKKDNLQRLHDMTQPQLQTHLCELCGVGFGVKTGLIEHHRSAHPDYETLQLADKIKVAFNISFPKIK